MPAPCDGEIRENIHVLASCVVRVGIRNAAISKAYPSYTMALRLSITCGAQPTNAFFATVNQMFGGSSQLPTMLSELFNDLI